MLLLLPCIINVNLTVVSSLDREDCLDDLSKEYDEGNVEFCVLTFWCRNYFFNCSISCI